MGNALIVEDDPAWARMFAEILIEDTPYNNFDISDNLESALKNARMTQYGLYVCDGDFPLKPSEFMHEGAFFLFYEELCRISLRPNIVLLSINEKNIEKARNIGIDCYNKRKYDAGLIARLNSCPEQIKGT